MSDEARKPSSSGVLSILLSDVRSTLRFLAWAVPAFLVCYPFYWLWWLSPPNRGPLFPPDDFLGAAYDVCEQFVTQSLETPSTARFPGRFSQDTTIDLGTVVPPPSSEAAYGSSQARGWQYRVRSYVDAQNNFGAVIRNHFVCIATWGHAVGSSDSDHWFLDDLAKTRWSSSLTGAVEKTPFATSPPNT